MIAEVAVNRPINKIFDYTVPENLTKHIKTGQRVKISFAHKKTIGFVVALKEKSDFKRLSSLEGLVDERAIYSCDLLKLAKEVADYYFCSWGQILEAGVPFALKSKKSIVKNFDKSESTDKVNSSLFKKAKFNEFLYIFHNSKDKIDNYKKEIEDTLSKGRQVLLLCPDAFSVEYLRRALKEKFSVNMVTFSSQQSQKLNKSNLEKLYNGTASIIIGTRSCIFLDIKHLGLIILEQEESEFYKRPDTPRYDARQAAFLRARMNNLVLLRTSSSPSLKTYFKYKNNTLKLKESPEARPQIKDFQLIDLKEEEDITTRKKFISFRLQTQLKACLQKKRQAVIVFNRRGSASIIKCQNCAEILKCPRCETILSYHYDLACAVCHQCNYTQSVPKICPNCSQAYLKYFGYGTQKLESNLAYMFPEARIERLDIDEASKIKDRFKIIEDYNKGRIDFLIVTQILGAGIDFTKTNCLAVLSLESLINQNDFRGLEKSFSFMFTLLNEYYSNSKEPHFLIQTFLSNLKALEFLEANNYKSFLELELKERKALKLPPYSSLSKIHFRSSEAPKVRKAAEDFIKKLNELSKANELNQASRLTKENISLNPSEAQGVEIYKQRGSSAAVIDLRAADLKDTKAVLGKVLAEYKVPAKVLMVVELEAV
jgi:primosomal protein N' (replication factor Y)